MKKIFYTAAIISLFAFHFSLCEAQDAVYKLLKYEWTLNADGTSDYHYRHEVQILRNRALVAYADKGETFVVYNPDLEELTVNEVYTMQKDGTRIDMPQNAFVLQLPSQCADCGRFNHLRELAMVHTGMELGCTIVVDYTIHRRYNMLHESIPIQRECPVEKLEVVVNYNDNEMELSYNIDGSQYLDFNNMERVESINTETMDMVLRYTFVNVQQAPNEYYMPADIIPTLRLYNGVPEFTPAFDRNKLEAANEAVGQQMNGNDRESITAIRDFVVDNIHLNDIAPAKLGYVHSTAAEVWQTGCGTATDKAVLLAAMLNQAGYDAHVAGDAYDEVAVTIDTLEYRLDVRRKSPLALYGEAKDEVTKYVMSPNNNEPVLDTIEDGFYHLVLPTLPGSPAVRASNLTITRTTPVQSSACELRSDVTYLLPKGMKMVKDATKVKLNYEGLGSVEILIKQSGKKMRVVRNLTLEKSIVPTEDYANYRRLIVAWQSVGKVLLQSK